MILTLYYMATTWLQSWKLRSIYSVLHKKFIENSSFVFYNLNEQKNDEISFTSTSSELCFNYDQARINDLICLDNLHRGFTVIPIQKININSWITFPKSPTYIPFEQNCDLIYNLNEKELINLLLEVKIDKIHSNNNEIEIENFGIPIAWKVDSHLSILLKTDLIHFCNLINLSFFQNFNVINNGLNLIRAETVDIEGCPQPYEQIIIHSRILNINQRINCWDKYLEGLKNMCILAYQATEYELSKQKTEVITNVSTVKPDLISSNNIEQTSNNSNDNQIIDASIKENLKLTEKSDIELVNISSIDSSEKLKKTLPEQQLHQSSERKKSPIRFTENLTKNSEPTASSIQSLKLTPNNTPSTSTTSKDILDKNVKEKTQLITSERKNKPEIKSLKSKQETNIETKKSNEKEKISKKLFNKPSKDDQKKLDGGNKKSESSSIVPKLKNDKSLEKSSKEIKKNETKIKMNVAESNIKSSVKPKTSNLNDARPKLKRTKGNSLDCKPPNILVFSESTVTRDNVISTLQSVLDRDKYTIYPLTQSQIDAQIWSEYATLLVVCGNVALSTGKLLLEFFLKGGKMFCLCSDLLHVVLPTYHTAEVRENELVRFSYNKWKNIKMMHHIFCYQPSPVRKHFSHDSDEIYVPPSQSLMYPRSVDVQDLQGIVHYLSVQVLGTEETWNTPSLLLASNVKTGGKAIFSQVHLETDPVQYESDETKFSVLQENEKSRLEILADILSNTLGIAASVQDLVQPNYSCAYFLGRHDYKFQFLEKMKPKLKIDNTIDNGKMILKFIGKNEKTLNATLNFLPIMSYACPDDFSTVDYYDNLKTEKIGRLLFYVPLISTSTNVLSNLNLAHGLVVVPRQQSQGSGRTQNRWLSPKGCLMFSLQLHVPLDSELGNRVSLLQHLVGVAVVQAVLNLDGCQNLDIGLKWPNDIIANGMIKIGGLMIDCIVEDKLVICNIGCGINFSNSVPTLCVLDLINERNRMYDENIPIPSYEKFLADIFTEIENLYNKVLNGNINDFYELYYKYWLHSDADIKIINKNGDKKNAKIKGIDEFGYLLVEEEGKSVPETVFPEGNSFDMLHGLIVPKN